MMINYVCFYTVSTSNPICYIILYDYNKMDVCDPDAKTKNIRKLIKLHTGRTVDVPRERMCEITREAKKGNLPMPPLVLTKDKRFLLDPKSPLTQKDYETLYKSSVTSAVVKRLAKKVGLVNTDKTIIDLKDAIGRRLASNNVREPILLPGTRVVSAVRSLKPVANTDRNQDRNENQDRNRNENQDRNRGENQDRNRNENQDRNRNENQDRNNNSAGRNGTRPNETRPKSVRNAISDRHRDRIKSFQNNRRENNRREPNQRKPGFFGRIFGGSKNTSTNRLNTEMKLAQMKRNTQRQMSHHRAVQTRLRLREAKLAKNRISEAERIKRQAINDVTRMQNNKHLLEIELNRRQNKGRRNAEALGQSRRELAKEKLHAGELNARIAALRRGAIQARDQAKKNIAKAEKKVTDKNKNINLKQSEINKAKENLNAASKKVNAYKKSTDSALAKIQELKKQMETAGNAGNSEKVKTLESRINTLMTELEEAKKNPVTVVQNAELITKKIELSRKAAEAGLNFKKNINALTMNNVKANGAPKVLALENKIKTAAKKIELSRKAAEAGLNFKKNINALTMNNVKANGAPKVVALENKIKAAANAKAKAEKARLNQIENERREERAAAQANLEAAQAKIAAAEEAAAAAQKNRNEKRKQKFENLLTQFNNVINNSQKSAFQKRFTNAQKARETLNANRTNNQKGNIIRGGLAQIAAELRKIKANRNEANHTAAIASAKAAGSANEVAKQKNVYLQKRQASFNKMVQNAKNRHPLNSNQRPVLNMMITNLTTKFNRGQEERKKNGQQNQNIINAGKIPELAKAIRELENEFNQNQRKKNAQNIKNAQEKAKKAETNRNQAQIQSKANLEAAQKAAEVAQNELAKSKNASKLANKKRELTNLAREQRVLQNLELNNLPPGAVGPRRPRRAFSTIINGLTVNDLANGGLAGKLPNQIKAAGTAKKANQNAKKKAEMEAAEKRRQEKQETKRKQREAAAAKAKANQEKREQQKASVIQSIKNAQNASKAKAQLRERLNKMKTIITEKRKANEAAKVKENRIKKECESNPYLDQCEGARDAREKAAEKKAYKQNLTKLLNSYNNRLGSPSWPNKKNELFKKYANTITKDKVIRAELNSMTKIHMENTRRIALEKKQAEAKQRREKQEKDAAETRAKRNAERKAAEENAKKEKNNMNARMKATRNKLAMKKAARELVNARIAYRTNVLMATKEGRLPQNQKEYWTRQANTAMNMSTIQGVDKMFKIHLEKMKREKNAATKIQAAFKGGQVRKSVGGSSMGKDILKKHVSGVNVMAGQKIPGFSGKRVEDKGYERDWLKRVDEEGDTAVKRAKLKKMFDDKFKLKMDLLQNEQSNVRKAYKLGGLKAMKTQVMRPRYKQDQSTKGTDQNLAIQNVKDIKDAIQAARIKASMNKMTTKYNNPIATNNRMPKNTKSSAAFNMKGGFNGGTRLGSGGNKNINGVNMTLKRAKPSLKNITQKKVIRPARMASQMKPKPAQGPTVMKLGVQAAVAKNKLGKPMTNVERRVAAREAAGATGRLGARVNAAAVRNSAEGAAEAAKLALRKKSEVNYVKKTLGGRSWKNEKRFIKDIEAAGTNTEIQRVVREVNKKARTIKNI
jgi:hypothetical protein